MWAVIVRQLTTDTAHSGKALYRELYRQVKSLPKETQLYYRNYMRQHFINWDNETDPETLQQLFAKARQDAHWVLNKAEHIPALYDCSSPPIRMTVAAALKTQRLPAQLQHQSKAQDVAAGVVSTVFWMAASSALIIYNKELYDRGFPFPQMVTGMGQVFSVLGGLLLAASGIMPLRSPPSKLSDVTRLVPIIACTAATMYFGNTAYLHLSVSFIQILKAFTPALTLVIGAAAGVEQLKLSLVVSVLLIAVGTGIAVLAESGTPAYSLLGLMLFMGSSVTEAGRVVAGQLLLGPNKYNSAEVLVYVGLPSALVLIMGSLLTERQRGMLTAAQVLIEARPEAFLKAFSMSCLVNLTSYMAIATTSSLTFKVAGCLKNLAVVWYGVVVHNDHVTKGHLFGYAVSIAGFVLYSRLKSQPKAANAVDKER
eukprot:gene6948-7165_t